MAISTSSKAKRGRLTLSLGSSDRANGSKPFSTGEGRAPKTDPFAPKQPVSMITCRRGLEALRYSLGRNRLHRLDGSGTGYGALCHHIV